jgi:hypothetical protein
MRKEVEEETRFTIQIMLAVLVQPLAAILMWINLSGRTDLGPRRKAFWACASFVWIFGPLAYIMIGGGRLW